MHTYIHTPMYIYVCMYVYMYVYMYVLCIYVCIVYVCMYVHTSILVVELFDISGGNCPSPRGIVQVGICPGGRVSEGESVQGKRSNTHKTDKISVLNDI